MSCLGNAAMNPAQLLAHFDRISEAPDAIPRLRCFILDLAVRGKLVEQNPNDEPAGELLSLFKSNSYVVPNWIAAKVGKLLDLQYGKGFAASERLDQGRVCVFGSNGIVGYCNEALTEEAAIIIGRKGSAGALNLCMGPSWTTDVAYFVNPPAFFDISFLFIALQTLDLGNLGKGVKPGLSRNDAYQLDIAVPPLAEQHRIVAKVDELMALCDQLEAAKAERENQRDRLIAASLHRLNSSADADASREYARFYLNHLPRLTTRPEHIKQLRQTILNLAVRGRLVPQDPNDELAGELLKRIQEQKAMLVKSGEIREIRKGNLLPLVDKNQTLYSLPTGWEWTRLGVVCFLISDGTHHTPKYENSGIHFLSVKDVSSGSINFSNTRFISEATHLELCKRCKPEFGDILLTKVGTTGIAVTVDTTQEFSIFVSLALLKFSQINLDGQYLRMLINSPFVRQQSADNTQGIGNKNLVLRLINQFSIPLPPLAEQHRIVAKVDELMALCDQLETQLTTTQTDNRRLLEALLHRALEEPDLIPFLSRL